LTSPATTRANQSHPLFDMPSYRSKMCCAHREPTVKRPRKVLTAEEKEDAKLKRDINKMMKENRVEWEATLQPWVEGASAFRHPAGIYVRPECHLPRVQFG
jgi:hypothetical protein